MIKVSKDFNKPEGYSSEMIKIRVRVDTNVWERNVLRRKTFFLERLTGQEQKRKIASPLRSTQLN